MNRISRIIFSVLILGCSVSIVQAAPKPIVEIDTSMGTITLALDHRRAPGTVNNFLKYIKREKFNNTIFHRVIKGFMIQGGGFTPAGVQNATLAPIKNESKNGLENKTGTIAMARTSDIDSATSQFFINVNNNSSLNATFNKHGYAVFGEVISGMDIVMAIADVDVTPNKYLGQNAPVISVIIHSIKLIPQDKKEDSAETKTK